MTWKGLPPVVEVLETACKKGMKIAKKAFQSFADRMARHPSLPKYGVTLKPKGG